MKILYRYYYSNDLLERGYQQAAVLHGEAEGRGEQDDVALLARDGHQHLPGLHPEHDLRGEIRAGHLLTVGSFLSLLL